MIDALHQCQYNIAEAGFGGRSRNIFWKSKHEYMDLQQRKKTLFLVCLIRKFEINTPGLFFIMLILSSSFSRLK